jgi:hypothetical protein
MAQMFLSLEEWLALLGRAPGVPVADLLTVGERLVDSLQDIKDAILANSDAIAQNTEALAQATEAIAVEIEQAAVLLGAATSDADRQMVMNMLLTQHDALVAQGTSIRGQADAIRSIVPDAPVASPVEPPPAG